MSLQNKLVSLLIPNFDGLEHLKICIPSILNQTHTETELIVVDNGSTDGSATFLKSIPGLKLVENEANLGFAKAVNQAGRVSSGAYLFVLNNDTALESKCIENLIREFERLSAQGIPVAGLSPKILFYEFPTIIDAIGTGMSFNGTGYNIGVGQIDLGQFDSPARIFGLCFAAAFLRRDFFDTIGPLEEGYYAYYEDTDWCYRANARGYEFRSAPRAVVYHRHSATSRKIMVYDQKRYLLGRNRIRTALRNYYGRSLVNIAWPIASPVFEIYSTIRHPLSRPPRASLRELALNLRIIADLMRIPILLQQNAKINASRKVSDDAIWKVSESWRPWQVERTFYDAAHSPILSLETLAAEYAIAARVSRSEELRRHHRALSILARVVRNENWALDGLEQMKFDAQKEFHLKDFVARSGGPKGGWFISKRTQSVLTDLFLIDLLLSFHAKDREEVISSLEEKLRPLFTSSPREHELPLKVICENCVSVLASQFEAWGLIASGGARS